MRRKKKIKSNQISLVRQIFVYLIGATILSVFIVGIFWVSSKISEFRKEAGLIRASFSENQKVAIRSKVLGIKDYLDWIHAYPTDPLTVLLKQQAEDISRRFKDSPDAVPISEWITRAGIDTLFCLHIPFSIYNREKEKVFEFRPRIFGTDNIPAEPKASLMDKIFNSTRDHGHFVHYVNENDSSERPSAVAGFVKNRTAGFTVVSMACGEKQINEALKVFALDTISRIRFSENEYIFVNSIDGYALVTHGKYNTIPRKIGNSDNDVWIKTYEIQRTSAHRQEGVYNSYYWPLLNSSETSLKTSYFSYYPKWGWIIGTGYYEKDVEPLIDTLRKELIADLRGNIASIALYIIFATLLCYFLARYLSGQIYKNLEIFKVFFERSVKADERIDMSHLKYKEFVFIAGAANTMADQRYQAEKEIRKLNEELEERVRLRTAQLETANQDLESFSYSISHDLRAPLRAITGFSHILSTRHKSGLNEEGRKYMAFIGEASQRMENLINDLLGYSRLVRKTPDLQRVSLKDLCESILMIFHQELDKAGARITIQDDLPEIISDKTLLQQILTNLVSNAIKYRRGNVPLQIYCGYNKEGASHVLFVSDNGIGIPEEYKMKIFEVFQRLHSDNEYPGTGIGLASVKKAVALLNGKIRVESVVNEGSTFYIKLPENK
ncbi:MAG: cache domain-containing protein [Bacteroidales bacterium]|nr:cache domain-containing protein [Bacteroidales bacterium]